MWILANCGNFGEFAKSAQTQLEPALAHHPHFLCLALHSNPTLVQSNYLQVSREPNPFIASRHLLPHLLMYLIARHSHKGRSCNWHDPSLVIQGVKRKSDNNDNDDTLMIFWNLLAHEFDENDKDNEDNEDKDSEDSEDDKNMDNTLGWISCWINRLLGEGGCKSKDRCPGWGKPEILKTAGIKEAQYNNYMVSILIILTVGLTDSISPRHLLTTSVTDTSTPRRLLLTTLCFAQQSLGSSLKKYIPSYLFFSIHWQWGDEGTSPMLLVSHQWLAHLPFSCEALPSEVPAVHQDGQWPGHQNVWRLHDQPEAGEAEEGTEASCSALQAVDVAWTQGQCCSPFSIHWSP